MPHFAGRKFPTPEAYKVASLASDGVARPKSVSRSCAIPGQRAKAIALLGDHCACYPLHIIFVAQIKDLAVLKPCVRNNN